MASRVHLRLPGLKALIKLFVAGRNPTYERMMIQLAAVYQADMRKRYNKFSRGGGDWAPLKKSTLRGRKGKGKQSILADTGLLRNALTFGGRGSVLKMVDAKTARVGFSDTMNHPDTGLSFAELAAIHQAGNPSKNLPAREILADPSAAAKRKMVAIIKKTIAHVGGSRGSR